MSDNHVKWTLSIPVVVHVPPIDMRITGDAAIYRIFCDGSMMRHDGGDPGDEHCSPPTFTIEESHDGVTWRPSESGIR